MGPTLTCEDVVESQESSQLRRAFPFDCICSFSLSPGLRCIKSLQHLSRRSSPLYSAYTARCRRSADLSAAAPFLGVGRVCGIVKVRGREWRGVDEPVSEPPARLNPCSLRTAPQGQFASLLLVSERPGQLLLSLMTFRVSHNVFLPLTLSPWASLPFESRPPSFRRRS